MPNPPPIYPWQVAKLGNELFGRQFGQLAYIVADTCAHPPWFYVKTSIQPLGHLVAELVELDMAQIVRNYFRPKNIRGGGCGGRRKRKTNTNGDLYDEEKRTRRGIPDPNESIAHRLPGQGEVAAEEWSNGVNKGWIILETVERVAFYVMLYHLVTDFLYSWSSIIYKFDKDSKCSPGGAGQRGHANAPPVPFGWKWVSFTTSSYQYGLGETEPGLVKVFGLLGNVVCCCTFENQTASHGHIMVGLAHGAAPGEWIVEPDILELGPGERADVCFDGSTNVNGAASLQYEMFGVGIWPIKGMLCIVAGIGSEPS